ncbi:EthD family reductase [Arthrobacter sp. SLBN-122]|uniref:EthD family reductase n=1 Tax=Arthrobacter sp. SLBN-122 TaxID=2768455 RepID=UPI001151A47B
MSPLVLAVPGVQAYVQNRCMPALDGADPPYADLGEVWFESREAAAAATQSPEWSAVIADAREFMDTSTIVVVWAGGASGIGPAPEPMYAQVEIALAAADSATPPGLQPPTQRG